jgi:hypothetical protein
VYLIGASGGHADYAGNEVNALDLSAATPKWTMIGAPSANVDIVDAAAVYLDGRRSSTHTYYGQQFDDRNDRLVILPAPGMGWSSLPRPPDTAPYNEPHLVMGFDVGRREWDPVDAYPIWPGARSSDFTACLACTDPVNGYFYYARNYDNGRLWRFSTASKTWQQLGSIGHQNYAGSAVDHTRGRILIVGGYSPTAPRVVSIAGAGLSVSFGGLGASAITASGYPAVVYDDVRDAFLVFVNTNPISVYMVDARTWEVSAPPVTAHPSLPTNSTRPTARTNGLHNSVQYAPELRGIVVANSYAGNVYYMRTS